MAHASSRPHRVFIGLGGNLDSPRSRVRGALDALDAQSGVRVLGCSRLYASSPVGKLDQPDFINAVALIETALAPHELLEVLLEVERRAGRVRGERYGPRTLDIDILLFDDLEMSEPTLTIPHPRMHERAFVLKPLLEIDPAVSIPGLGLAADFLRLISDQRCEPDE